MAATDKITPYSSKDREQKPSKRLEFVDLAKGVCILLVVIRHCQADVPIPGFDMMRMPLYFILSGLFFKDYGGFLAFAIKKTNKILIPFCFFYLLSYIPFYLISYLKPELIVTQAKGLLDVFDNRVLFNGPIWFLLCLFWTNIIFCLVKLYVSTEYLRGVIVLSIGLLGILLGDREIFLPCFIDVGMSALPYFYFGYLLTKTDLLYPNKYDKYNLLIAAGLYLVTYTLTYVFDNPNMYFRDNIMYGSIIVNYVGSFSCVIAILLLCKQIGRLPFVSFCGRYSIILLCLHHLILRPLILGFKMIGVSQNWVIAIATIAITAALIPPCIRIIPMFTAQRDLIKPKVRQHQPEHPKTPACHGSFI